VIIYISIRVNADRVADELKCSCYYFDSDTFKKKTAVLTEWRVDDSSVIAIIDAFEMRMNHLRVRLVIHIETFRSIIDFAQKTERLKQDDSDESFYVLLLIS
jgi:superfamily II DNA helicase RecQ